MSCKNKNCKNKKGSLVETDCNSNSVLDVFAKKANADLSEFEKKVLTVFAQEAVSTTKDQMEKIVFLERALNRDAEIISKTMDFCIEQVNSFKEEKEHAEKTNEKDSHYFLMKGWMECASYVRFLLQGRHEGKENKAIADGLRSIRSREWQEQEIAKSGGYYSNGKWKTEVSTDE
tara:strand:- start:7591 stop:8115 length:525 start_codon:yes stop_codon:yes gene_type:complete